MKEVTAILIGGELRGDEAYAEYALKYPSELEVISVAEPDALRQAVFAKKYEISREYRFHDYKEVLQKEKFADCVFVCTQDKMHYEPVMMALEQGYHILCEKPMAVEKGEMIQMAKKAEEQDLILSICHVLRYAAFFIKLKELLDALEQGAYGRCVYHCDNTVADQQIVNMEFMNDVHVSFTMSTFTKTCSREINLMGTKGHIKEGIK